MTKLFDNYTPSINEAKPTRARAKREPTKKKEPSITDLNFEIRKCRDRLKELEAQDEAGWSDFDIGIKGKEVNMRLVNNHIAYYQKQIEALQEPFNPLLNKWKLFIQQLCKEKGQEIDKIWFDVSAPYDCEIAVRMKGHRCWSACVEFRFTKGTLKAYDSGFGGGTSFVFPRAETDEQIGSKIKEIMEKVFNKACDNEYVQFWKEDRGHREINVADNGWIKE